MSTLETVNIVISVINILLIIVIFYLLNIHRGKLIFSIPDEITINKISNKKYKLSFPIICINTGQYYKILDIVELKNHLFFRSGLLHLIPPNKKYEFYNIKKIEDLSLGKSIKSPIIIKPKEVKNFYFYFIIDIDFNLMKIRSNIMISLDVRFSKNGIQWKYKEVFRHLYYCIYAKGKIAYFSHLGKNPKSFYHMYQTPKRKKRRFFIFKSNIRYFIKEKIYHKIFKNYNK